MAQKIKKRFGNFVFTHDEKQGFVSVRAASGFWSIRFRNDHPMFGALLRLTEDKDADRYFEHLFTMWYVLSQGLPDGECLDEVVKSCQSWYERMKNAEKVKEVSKEEDDEIVKEVATAEEMREEILSDGGN